MHVSCVKRVNDAFLKTLDLQNDIIVLKPSMASDRKGTHINISQVLTYIFVMLEL